MKLPHPLAGFIEKYPARNAGVVFYFAAGLITETV